MSGNYSTMLAVTTALTALIPASAFAQASADSKGDEEIIVTARREAENLQDVPVSVQVLGGDQLQKLSITSVNEIAKLSPGLTLSGTAANEVVIARGVRWTPGSGTPATPIYLNELAFDPASVLQTLFDVGQVEVLRGPQGTARGAPSISGAITITTRRPNLTEFGGYVQGMYGTADHWNLQGAVNVPIVSDVLAVRLAANFEHSEFNRVRSLNNTLSPRLKSETFRASVLFKPTDTIRIDAMFQRSRQLARFFPQVVGTGSPGFAALGIPANFNGPALTVEDRKSVQDTPAYYPKNVDFLTINASWDFLGQRLSYNFGRQFAYNDKFDTTYGDPGNVLPGYSPPQTQNNLGMSRFSIHEVRLSSIREPGRFFDYDVGYYTKQSGGTIALRSFAFLPGAFGAPFMALPGAVTSPVARYTIPVQTEVSIGQNYQSIYGNIQFHIGEKTEFSAGVRRIWDKVPVVLQVGLGNAFVTFPRFLPAAAGGCPSVFLPDSPVYGALYCDVQATTAGPPSVEVHDDKFSATIYNISLSHRFSDAVLAYATVGSSFRSGLPAIGNTGLPANAVIAKPEKATSYEVGVKTNLLPGVRFNVSVFQIDYKDQLTQFQGINYINSASGQISSTSLSFYANVDSRVRGFEAEFAARVTDHFNLAANVAYAKVLSRGGVVPCNAATPLTAANPINTCQSPSGQTLNASAPFQASFSGDYSVPLGELEGYFRFNVNYQGHNPNYSASTVEAKAHAIVDLFAGVSGKDGAWDIGVYAKNVFNKQVLLTSLPITSPYPVFAAPVGYEGVNTTLPREVGATLRWSFGSR